jgi:hypothetical protein
MRQLTKQEIAEMCKLLAPHGLVVKTLPKPRSSIKAWKPQTPAGSKCKSRMLMFAKLGPSVGVKNYRKLDVPFMPNDPHVIAAYYANLDDRDFDQCH